MISSAVPCSCAAGFASFSYWLSIRYFGFVARHLLGDADRAVRPLIAGRQVHLSRRTSRACAAARVDTDSGMTISSAMPLMRQIIAIEMPVFPDDGSSRTRSSCQADRRARRRRSSTSRCGPSPTRSGSVLRASRRAACPPARGSGSPTSGVSPIGVDRGLERTRSLAPGDRRKDRSRCRRPQTFVSRPSRYRTSSSFA